MKFRADFVDQFLLTFKTYRHQIRNAEGCLNLELLRDVNDPNIFMTYSWWRNASDLEAYRHSQTFKEVWPLTKVGFAEKPQAWSLEQFDKVE